MSENREWKRFSERWRTPWPPFIPLSLLIHLLFAALVFILPTQPIPVATGSFQSPEIQDSFPTDSSSQSNGEASEGEKSTTQEQVEEQLRDTFEALAADHLSEEEVEQSWEKLEELLEEEIVQFEETLGSIEAGELEEEPMPLETQMAQIEEAWEDLELAMLDELVEMIEDSPSEDGITETAALMDHQGLAEDRDKDHANSPENPAGDEKTADPASAGAPGREEAGLLTEANQSPKATREETETTSQEGSGERTEADSLDNPEDPADGETPAADVLPDAGGIAYFVPPELVEIRPLKNLTPAERVALAQSTVRRSLQPPGSEQKSGEKASETRESGEVGSEAEFSPAKSGAADKGAVESGSTLASRGDRGDSDGEFSMASVLNRQTRDADASSQGQTRPPQKSGKPSPKDQRTLTGGTSKQNNVERPPRMGQSTLSAGDSAASRGSPLSNQGPGTAKATGESGLISNDGVTGKNLETARGSSSRGTGPSGTRELDVTGVERNDSPGFKDNVLRLRSQVRPGGEAGTQGPLTGMKEEWLSSLVRRFSVAPGPSGSRVSDDPKSSLSPRSPEGGVNDLIRPALVMVPAVRPSSSKNSDQPTEAASTRCANRYAVAPFRSERSVKLDGDLSEWQGAPTLTLDRTRGREEGTATRPGHQTAWIAHSPDSIFIAADIVDTSGGLENSRAIRNFWENDGLEIYFDRTNAKKEQRGLETHQFVVFPFGHSEMSKRTGGYEVLAEREDGKVYWSRAQALSAREIRAAGQPTSRGWSIEVMLDKSLLRGSKVAADTIVGFNLQVNTGSDLYYFWSAEPQRRPSHFPNTWGTVKLLAAGGPEVVLVDEPLGSEIKAARPGRPLYVRVTDLPSSGSGAIRAVLQTGGGDSENLVLDEIDRGSGIFEGGIPTQLSSGIRVPEVLELYEGDKLSVTYSHRDKTTKKPFPVSSFGRRIVHR